MAEPPAIPNFVRQAIWLSLFAFGFSALGMPLLAMALFPAPVAVCWVREARTPAMVLVLISGVVSAVTMAAWPWALTAVVVAAMGALLGAAIGKGLTYGQCVSVLTGVGSVLVGIYLVVNGPAVHKWCTIWLAARVAEFEATGDAESPTLGMAEWFRWLGENLVNLGFGLAFGMVFLASVVLVASVARQLRSAGLQPPGRFRDMRTPEWVVWLAIAAAVLFIADYRWPHAALRAVSWNMAQTLELVYGLNGLSIVVYALGVLVKGSARYHAALVILVVLLFRPAITFLGLFDTWLDFRRKADRLAEARRARQSDNDGES